MRQDEDDGKCHYRGLERKGGTVAARVSTRQISGRLEPRASIRARNCALSTRANVLNVRITYAMTKMFQPTSHNSITVALPPTPDPWRHREHHCGQHRQREGEQQGDQCSA